MGADGTYSNGSLMACQQHTKCEIKGLTEIKAGTTSSDAECEKVTSVELIVGVTVTVLVAVLVPLITYIIYRKHKARCSNKRECYKKPQQATEDDPEPNHNSSESGPGSDGSVVRSDCKDDLSTTCQPCAPGTFMSEPNGLHKCFICRNCAQNQGIYIQSKCTTIKDTVCDVLDGYHCVEYSNSQCRHALKHSVCEPGQETKTPGTKNSDTVCVDCTAGFYSPSGLKCTKWTDVLFKKPLQIQHNPCETHRRKKMSVLVTSPSCLNPCMWSVRECDCIGVFSVCCDLDVVEKLEHLQELLPVEPFTTPG
ncbi:unnamed protein product [Leuciscus chuanchicus]